MPFSFASFFHMRWNSSSLGGGGSFPSFFSTASRTISAKFLAAPRISTSVILAYFTLYLGSFSSKRGERTISRCFFGRMGAVFFLGFGMGVLYCSSDVQRSKSDTVRLQVMKEVQRDVLIVDFVRFAYDQGGTEHTAYLQNALPNIEGYVSTCGDGDYR